MILEKDTYSVGEKVVIKGIEGIGGITGPYKYRLHIFSPDKIGKAGRGFDNSGWVKNVTKYGDTVEWTPTEPGTYVLDVHAITPNSTLWKNVVKTPSIIYGGYEAWKLKTITVVGEPIDLMKGSKEFIDSLYKTNSPYWNDGLKFIDGELKIKQYDYVTGVISWKALPTAYNPDINKQTLDVVEALYVYKEGFDVEIVRGGGEDKSDVSVISFYGPNMTMGGAFMEIHFYTSPNATIINKNIYSGISIPECSSEQFETNKGLIKKPLEIIVGVENLEEIFSYVTSEYRKCVIENAYNIPELKPIGIKTYDKVIGNFKVSLFSNGNIFAVSFTKL
jgi:hypothetical protein